MKVVIIGKGLLLANLILGALDAGAEIVGVFRYEQTSTNRVKLFFQDLFNPAPELTLINQLKLNQIRLKSVNSQKFQKILLSQNVDLLLVGTWKERISKETFNMPKIATINVHPSLLPAYRGPNPYMQTILHGEEYSGVTLHLVDEKYDCGAILAQEKIKILPSDTSKELRQRTVRVARTLMSNLLKDLNSKILTPVEQNEKNASYFPNISGEEKMLDFTIQSSEEVSRTVRALYPFLPCYITYKNEFFIVNPYKFSILLDTMNGSFAGDIVAKNPDKKSLTIVCKDKKAIRFSDLELYKKKFETAYYIDEVVELNKN
jgi:methionyl-tRNA formyltransferase